MVDIGIMRVFSGPLILILTSFFFQVICIFESNLKFYLKVFGDKNEVNLK